MSRKSAITRLPAEQRLFVEKLIREDRHTLSEMMEAIRQKFPTAELSRSGLHRYQSNIAELTARMREIDQAASAFVGELGDGIGEKASALLAQAVTTLATNAALRAQEDEDLSIDEVRKLARAAKDALHTRQLSLRERQTIEQVAREKALREAASRVDSAAQERGLSAEDARFWREQVLMGM